MYDDRITSVESDDRVIYEMMEAQAAEMQNWIADVVETASAVYDPTPEYLDQES